MGSLIRTENLKELLDADALDFGNTVDQVDLNQELSDKCTNKSLGALKARVRCGLEEVLSSSGVKHCDFSEIKSCNETLSRQLIDAVLVPFCHAASLRLALEERSGHGPMTVNGFADYLIRAESKQTGGKGLSSRILALVEAKRCEMKWPILLSQAIAQAIIQLVSLDVGNRQDQAGRLALISDGRRWVALELTNEALTLLLWPCPSKGVASGTPALDLPRMAIWRFCVTVCGSSLQHVR